LFCMCVQLGCIPHRPFSKTIVVIFQFLELGKLPNRWCEIFPNSRNWKITKIVFYCETRPV
jgi:hypothetical protein